LHLVSAPAAGTGKDLLAQLGPVLATGTTCATKSECQEEKEWRANLTSWLSEGPQFTYIENVNYALNSATFAKVLTGRKHRDRVYGRNDKEIEMPINCVWVATGNNPFMSSELARRTVLIRIDANCEQPCLRKGFRHKLPDWAEQNRTELVTACLTLIRGWVAAGMPKVQPAEQMGSFECWAETMGGILSVAGVPGFMGNWPNVTMDVNSTESEWAEFIHKWSKVYRDKWVTSQELYDHVACDTSPHQVYELPELLPSVFSRQFKGAPSHQLALGLSKRKHTVIEGFKIDCSASNHSHDRKTRWRLVSVSSGESNPPAGSCWGLLGVVTPDSSTDSNPPAGGCWGLLVSSISSRTEFSSNKNNSVSGNDSIQQPPATPSTLAGGSKVDAPLPLEEPVTDEQFGKWSAQLWDELAEEKELLAELPRDQSITPALLAQALFWPRERLDPVLRRMQEENRPELGWETVNDEVKYWRKT
jgi:hypothetical protein